MNTQTATIITRYFNLQFENKAEISLGDAKNDLTLFTPELPGVVIAKIIEEMIEEKFLVYGFSDYKAILKVGSRPITVENLVDYGSKAYKEWLEEWLTDEDEDWDDVA